MPEVSVEAYGRLHAALIDLGRATPRAYGGCGFAFGTPIVRVRARPSSSLALTHLTTIDSRGREDISRVLARLAERAARPIDLEFAIDGWIPQHVGLGTKTALLLALLDAANRALGLALSDHDLQVLSGRGGTSGVGIHTYFRGGFVLDAGHSQANVSTFGPSSSRVSPAVPPMLIWAPFPERWQVTLLTATGSRTQGEDENAFFSAATPVPAAEVLRTLALVHHEVAPAFIQHDLECLGASLRELHQVGFKARECAHQSDSVQRALWDCWKCGVVAGLSSMGSTIYTISSRDDDRHAALAAIAKSHDLATFGPVPPCNEGAVVV